MKIWAHRGLSQRYPENTITAFEQAVRVSLLTGIELDIQLTKDREIVVIHDEKVDRTTDSFGPVREHTLSELRKCHIHTGNEKPEYIPTLKEVLDLLEEPMKKGLLLNIELKNSVTDYPGMEEMAADLVCGRGIEKNIVWSSFSARSLQKVRTLLPDAEIGILDRRVSDCLYKLKGGCGANALHPSFKGMDLSPNELEGYTVRAYFGGHLYPEKPTGGVLDLKGLEEKGITDVFLNEPERYL